MGLGGLCCLSGSLLHCARQGAQPFGIGGAGWGSDLFHSLAYSGEGPRGAPVLKGFSGASGGLRGRNSQCEGLAAWWVERLESWEIHWESCPKAPSALLGSSQPSRNRFRVGAGRNVGGAKQAQGWVPSSRASLEAGGWACMGSKGGRLGTGPKGPSAELWKPFTFQALPTGPRGPFGPLPSQAPPPTPILLQPEHSLAASALSAPPRGPSLCAPAGLPSLETSVQGLALFTAAASSSFQ